MRVSLRLLGLIEIDGPRGPVCPHSPIQRRLLAALGVHAGRVVGEDALVDALWDGDPPRTAAKTLQNHVLRLRRSLAGLDGVRIVTRAPGYMLEVPATDVATAADLVDRARRATRDGEHDQAVGIFDDALSLWSGPALAEFAGHAFARGEAVRLDELRLAVAEDRVGAMLAGARHHEAVGVCETLVSEQPLRERRWTQLMTALYRDGRQAEALAAYRRLCDVLADQLGVDPGPEARDLERSILAHARRLNPPAPDPSPPPRWLSMHTASCVGREVELDRLAAHVATAAGGHGGVVLVHGEPGIGKSRVLTALGDAAVARGADVLYGRCPEGAGVPYAPFAEALETVDADPVAGSLAALAGTGIEPDLRPDERRLRLFDGVSRLLTGRATARTVLLLLDDLHWADETTIALLRHVGRVVTGRRILIVGAFRPGEIPGDHPLADALGALAGETDLHLVALSGLDVPAVTDLLSAAVGTPVATALAAGVRAETGGNPFLARELVRHLLEDGALHTDGDGNLDGPLAPSAVPDGARHVIARRRRRLSEDANRLLDAASGVEGPFPYEVARTVACLDDTRGLAALDAVLEAGLVRPDAAADRYDFTHALARHAVHNGLNPSRRLRLHRELARALSDARAEGARVEPAEIAVQFHRSVALPGAEAGVEPAREAADRAAALGAPDEQAALLTIARDLLPDGDTRGAEISGALAEARAWSLRFDDAVAAARDALTAGAGNDTVARVATALAGAGSTRHAWDLAARGLASTTSPAPDAVTWATLTLFDLDRREADDPDHPGMQLDLPGRREALRVLHESGRLAGRGDLGRYAVAAVHGTRDRIPADAAEDPTVAAYLTGDYARAAPAFARAADEALARGRLALAIYCRAGQSRCETALGHIDDGAVTAGEVRELVRRAPDLPLGWQLLHHQGAEDALVMALDEGWDARAQAFAPWMRPGPGQHWGIAAITAIGARIEAHRGMTDRAMSLLARPVRALRQAPAWAPNYARTACEVAETLWLLDRRDHLAVVEAALRDKALPTDFRFPMTDSRQALGRLCALDGRVDEAILWFDRARTVLDEQGARPQRAVVDHDEALMHRRLGDPERAEPARSAAAAAFAALGMTGWLSRIVPGPAHRDASRIAASPRSRSTTGR